MVVLRVDFGTSGAQEYKVPAPISELFVYATSHFPFEFIKSEWVHRFPCESDDEPETWEAMKRSEQEQVHSVEVSVKASNEDITRQFSDLYKMVCDFETLEYCEEGSDPKSRLKSEIAGSMRSFFSMCFNADLRAMDDLADRLNQVPGADVDGQLLREIFMEFLEEDIVKGLRECAKMSRQYSALGAQGVSGRKPYCS